MLNFMKETGDAIKSVLRSTVLSPSDSEYLATFRDSVADLRLDLGLLESEYWDFIMSENVRNW